MEVVQGLNISQSVRSKAWNHFLNIGSVDRQPGPGGSQKEQLHQKTVFSYYRFEETAKRLQVIWFWAFRL